MLPVGCGAVSLHTRISLPREDGGSEEEGRSPKSQRAGDERHRGEAEGGQHEAVTAEENKQKELVYHDDSVSLVYFLFISCTKKNILMISR